jgi:hypothetical protein
VRKVIITYTDNSLPEDFHTKTLEKLVEAAKGIPIILVAQKEINYGPNLYAKFYIGDIGRSHLSMYKQIQLGLVGTDAEIIYLAEHDCFYTPEHFEFEPTDEDTFYYNINRWFTQWEKGANDGQYSSTNKVALSQCVARKSILLPAIDARIKYLEAGYHITKGLMGACEPGVCDRTAFVEEPLPYIYKYHTFKTELPNLDVRNRRNFTGQRVGDSRRYELPYWGNFKQVMCS